jgi:hypothetical protein
LAGGGHQRRLTDDPGYNYFADFSPSGKSIVFVHRGRDSVGLPALFQMSADGSHRIRFGGLKIGAGIVGLGYAAVGQSELSGPGNWCGDVRAPIS